MIFLTKEFQFGGRIFLKEKSIGKTSFFFKWQFWRKKLKRIIDEKGSAFTNYQIEDIKMSFNLWVNSTH